MPMELRLLGDPPAVAMDTGTRRRHRGRDGQEPRPLQDCGAEGRDIEDKELRAGDIPREHEASELSAHEPDG